MWGFARLRPPAPGMLVGSIRRQTTAAVATHHDSQTMRLADGRTLGWAEWGNTSHPTLVFLHGFPGSRLEVSGVASLAERHGVRLLSPDRPGFGLSTAMPGRRIVDWPNDLAALLQHLDIPTATVLGGSGGGPYALACAAALPHVRAVGVLAGAPPWVPGLRLPLSSHIARALCLRTPALARGLTAATVSATRTIANAPPVARRIDEYLMKQGAPDTATAAAMRESTLRIALEGFAQGPNATVEEALLLSQNWGVPFADITKPVHVWHGTHDARAPIEAIRWMVEQMPNATLTEYDAGHFDIHKQIDEVVDTLMSRTQ